MKKFCIILFLGISFYSSSQESLSNLKYNSVLFNQKKVIGSTRDIGTTRDTLCLPFFDDFSNLNVFFDSINTICGDTVFNTNKSLYYPNHLYWIDSNAYRNLQIGILPPTYGVITLDGINKYGLPYNESIDFGAADSLTSKPIHLGGTLIDTLYLSFYFQPGGFADYPESTDTLLLEFKDVDNNWVKVWETTNQLGEVNQPFQLVMIPISDPSFLYHGFQFRFRNWASIFGNNDHWNLDYIFLDENRSFDDTLFRDVSFVTTPSKILNRYYQMPWNQFKDFQTEELNLDFNIQMKNNFNTIINTDHSYSAYEKYSNEIIVSPTSPIAENFAPNSTLFNTYSTYSIPSSTSGYEEDSMTITTQFVLAPSSDIFNMNDTLYFDQSYYNYFAYDDGTAERAYDLIGIGAKLAIEFHANKPDTLKEVYIHWAFVDGYKSNYFFSLMVWDEIDTTLSSADETILYQADFLTPKYVDSINGFYVYELVDFLGNPTPLIVDGTFYVGWLQTQSEPMHVGFDRNNDAHENVYYYIGGFWQQSELSGAIMIRPQVGGNYSKFSSTQFISLHSNIEIFPNPAENILNIQHSYQEPIYQIFDLSGKIFLQNQLLDSKINIQTLASGLYFISITDKNTGETTKSKFIKQ